MQASPNDHAGHPIQVAESSASDVAVAGPGRRGDARPLNQPWVTPTRKPSAQLSSGATSTAAIKPARDGIASHHGALSAAALTTVLTGMSA